MCRWHWRHVAAWFSGHFLRFLGTLLEITCGVVRLRTVLSVSGAVMPSTVSSIRIDVRRGANLARRWLPTHVNVCAAGISAPTYMVFCAFLDMLLANRCGGASQSNALVVDLCRFI